jgi:hypothetical protein
MSMEARPHYFYSKKPGDEDEVARNVLGITIKSTQPLAKSAGGAAFLETALTIIDDCCLLVSFLSGSWVTWYAYHLWTETQLVEHYRTVRHGVETDSQDTPVPLFKSREFLRTAIPRLRQLRCQSMDPHLAIRHAIAAAEAQTLEERFIGYFLALESLKDLHSQQRNSILPPSLFRKVKRALRESLAGFGHGEGIPLTQQQLVSLERKLPDLNRPAFVELLEAMLAEYGLDWRDLYPRTLESPRPPFIGLRDQLIHTGAVDSRPQLDLETIRLEGLVERVILRMLGWEDISSSPRPWFYELVKTKVGTEQDPDRQG